MAVRLPTINTYRTYKTANAGINYVKMSLSDDLTFYYYKKDLCAVSFYDSLLLDIYIPYSVYRSIKDDIDVKSPWNISRVRRSATIEEDFPEFINKTKEELATK